MFPRTGQKVVRQEVLSNLLLAAVEKDLPSDYCEKEVAKQTRRLQPGSMVL